MDLARIFLDRLIPQHISRMKCVELESKGPSFGILIVIFKKVASNHMLPLFHRFFDDAEVEEREESAFACAEVALDRDDS
jgi:hypothetical protein